MESSARGSNGGRSDLWDMGSSGDAINARGVTAPGALEASWKFDEGSGGIAFDSSGHQLHGTFRNRPGRVAGVRGGAVLFDGVKDFIDAGHFSAYRLAGSMTISAWMKATSFPNDDAAIVSQFQNGAGYQLDTTVDKGLRGIGFKLTNWCGDLMARYGATPLNTGTWYHVAGVYDADARTLDVYLNGKPDDGFPLGTVTGGQRSSRAGVSIGRRRNLDGFECAGAIDEVRGFTRLLLRGKRSWRTCMERSSNALLEQMKQAVKGGVGRLAVCRPKIPLAAALGVFTAIACTGFRPSIGNLPCLAASLSAGLLLLPVMAPSVPPLTR